jgi:hypothetical protein
LVPDPKNYVVILRFLGTTPATSNIINTFLSIIYQLSRIFNILLPEKGLNTKTEIKNFLEDQLLYISTKYPEKKIVLLLDSLDQLSTGDYNLEWIFTLLPANIKIIYSTLPSQGGILSQLEGLVDHENLMEVQQLKKTVVVTILEDWLKKVNRSLSEKQWEILDKIFNRAALFPLYTKLIFDIISKWTSFQVPNDEFKNCTNIDLCISYLFKIMEKNHGYLFLLSFYVYKYLF